MSDLQMHDPVPSLAVIIPWKDADCVHRRTSFRFLVTYYRHSLGLPVFIGTGRTRGEMRNDGAKQAHAAGYEVLAFIDADMMIPKEQLFLSAHVANATGLLCHQYSNLTRLNKGETQLLVRGSMPPIRQGLKESGAVTIKWSSFVKIHGYPKMDVKEDALVWVASQTLLGPPLYVTGNAFHLWHPAGDHVGSYGEQKLLMQFEAAMNNIGAMTELLETSKVYESASYWV